MKRLIYILISLFIVSCSIWWYTKPANHQQKNKIPTVTTIAAKMQSMPILLQTMGAVEAEQSVEITPQISGVIKQIYFREGQFVKKGQLLISIDPTESTLNLEQAQAILRRDQAQLQLVEADAKRYAALVKLEYVTRQQYEQANATATAQQAVVAADQAQVQQAQVQLGYTKIHAPISGKTGSLNVKMGDIVTANNATPLLIINKLNSVLINFSVSQNQLDQVLQYQKKGSLQVLIKSLDSQSTLKGKLVFIDNTVNPQTGTVALKASLENPQQLWPGQSVTVQLILAIQPQAIVIPTSAIQFDQNGNFVYVINQGLAKVQRITVDRQINRLAVISQGLKPNEQVLTQIPANLKDGMTVRIDDSGSGIQDLGTMRN